VVAASNVLCLRSLGATVELGALFCSSVGALGRMMDGIRCKLLLSARRTHVKSSHLIVLNIDWVDYICGHSQNTSYE
jgi:hypothetical protein